MQHGGFSTSREMNYLTSGTGLEFCVDLEHFNQAFEISSQYSVQNPNPKLSSHEREILGRFGLLVTQGEPLKFEAPLGLDEISRLENEIRSVHVGGQVAFSFQDLDGYMHIGSHMPLTPNNIFIQDPALREEHWTKGRSYVKSALEITHKRGCRNLTLEIHHPNYTGPEWTSMTRETLASVKQILNEL